MYTVRESDFETRSTFYENLDLQADYLKIGRKHPGAYKQIFVTNLIYRPTLIITKKSRKIR